MVVGITGTGVAVGGAGGVVGSGVGVAVGTGVGVGSCQLSPPVPILCFSEVAVFPSLE